MTIENLSLLTLDDGESPSGEAVSADALLLGKRRIYETTVQQGIKEAANLGKVVTRDEVIKALSKGIPDLKEILGDLQ